MLFRSLARRCVSQWGFSDAVGPVLVGDNEQELFLGREIMSRREVSERTAQLVDTEVARIINEAYQRARQVLTENSALLHIIASSLLERETLSRDEIEMIGRGETLPVRTSPPSAAMPPAPVIPAAVVPEPRRAPLLDGPKPAPA